MAGSVFQNASVEARYDVKVPMRDGVNLSADIYFPRGEQGPFPVILTRTPYDNMTEESLEAGRFYPQHGYVLVAQDVRGRNDSDGDFYPYLNDFNDGHDTVEWIGAQPWCDGNVGMVGASYVGYVQWQAASMGSSYLKAIVPRVIGANMYETGWYQGGAFHLGTAAMWAMRYDGRTRQDIFDYNWEQLFKKLPLAELDREAGKDVHFFRDWIAHPDYDDYWRAQSIEERYPNIKVPVLQIGGWYDVLVRGTFHHFTEMRKHAGSELARQNQRAVVGPWIHSACSTTFAGELDFGAISMLDLQEVELRWFDHWLKGKDNGAERDAPLRLFVMGSNEWRDENEWPLARTQFTPYYFHSGGGANSLEGDGSLSTVTPAGRAGRRLRVQPILPGPDPGRQHLLQPGARPVGRLRPASDRVPQRRARLHVSAPGGGPRGDGSNIGEAVRQHRRPGHRLHREARRRTSRRLRRQPVRQHHAGPLPRVEGVPDAPRAGQGVRVHDRPVDDEQRVPEGPPDQGGRVQQQLPEVQQETRTPATPSARTRSSGRPTRRSSTTRRILPISSCRSYRSRNTLGIP